jgi:hypothetical protein
VTYQLLRVEAEIYKPGDEINGATNVAWHNGKSFGVCLWVSDTGNMEDAAILTDEQIKFHKGATFVRLEPIGIECDGVNNGLLDRLFETMPVMDVIGQAMEDIVHIAIFNSKELNGRRVVAFIAVIDLNDKGCFFKGILPMDSALDSVIFTPVMMTALVQK